MLNGKKFNEWASEYDISVQKSKDVNEFPFAGYDELIDAVYSSVSRYCKMKILDIGFGTGNLTSKFYFDAHDITGIDFSDEMIRIAREKMINARLIRWDFSKGIPKELQGEKFDLIISTYAIHHLEDAEKVKFINSLKEYLHKDGVIFIGDVAFRNKDEHNDCKDRVGRRWDDEEVYIKFEEINDKLLFEEVTFKQISFCAGILKLND